MNRELKRLTKEDLKMIKSCDDLLFVLDDITQEERITCIFQSTKNKSDYIYKIEVNPRKYKDYSQYERCTVYASMASDCTRTIIESLKVDDILMFDWYQNKHTHNALKDAGMCADTLELIIERKNKRLKYEIYTQVTPINFRMIKLKK